MADFYKVTFLNAFVDYNSRMLPFSQGVSWASSAGLRSLNFSVSHTGVSHLPL